MQTVDPLLCTGLRVCLGLADAVDYYYHTEQRKSRIQGPRLSIPVQRSTPKLALPCRQLGLPSFQDYAMTRDCVLALSIATHFSASHRDIYVLWHGSRSLSKLEFASISVRAAQPRLGISLPNKEIPTSPGLSKHRIIIKSPGQVHINPTA